VDKFTFKPFVGLTVGFKKNLAINVSKSHIISQKELDVDYSTFQTFLAFKIEMNVFVINF
jgi:hypothetical protein